MQGKAGDWWKAGLQAAILCAAGVLAVIPAAAARSDRHHHVGPVFRPAPAYRPAPTDSGFGPTAPGVSSILIDAASGGVVAETGADIPRYPASLTKLMVLDLAFQALRDGRMTLDTALPVSWHASSVEPVKLGLQPGDAITVHDAILAMTTMSANDAATVLGEYLGGGSEARCAQMMNLRAHALGMAQSEFANASGLPNPNQVTTARDLSILARDIVVGFPEDQSFFEVQQFDLDGHTIYSNNQMLKLYPGATGMKTGYTILARHNLVTSAARNGRTLIGVVLHEPSWGQTYSDMTAMLDSGFGGVAPAGLAMARAQAPAPAPLAARPPVPAPLPHPWLFATANAAGAQPAVLAGGWTDVVGSYRKPVLARKQAIAVRQMRGIGIARIAKITSHGEVLWTAQLAGLSLTAAHQTCSALAAHGSSCRIIAPQADHLAAVSGRRSAVGMS